MPELVIEAGPQAGARIQLAPGCYRAGSDVGNDIVLLDPAVAGTHFLLEVGEGVIRIEPDEAALTLAGTRRALAVGAPPLTCGKPMRFVAGATRFVVDPRVELPGATPPLRRRRLPLAMLTLAGGLLLVASGTAPASIRTPNPQPAAAAAVPAGAAPAAPSPADILGQLQSHLHAAELDGVRPIPSADGSVTLTGTVPPALEPPLRAVQRWFDASFGARLMLIDAVKVANEPPPLAVRAAWTGAEPYVIDNTGQRLLLGARLASGWVITAIADDCITLQRDGRTLAVHF